MSAQAAPSLRSAALRSVLVVIENPAVRELLASHLRHARMLPLAAASAAEGQRLAAEVRPDAVLVDADAPDAAAWIALGNSAIGGLPVVVLCSGTHPNDMPMALPSMHRLLKPVVPLEVVRCLGERLALRPSPSAAPPPAAEARTLRHGPLALDLARHEVRIALDGHTDVVTLPRAELALLRCLVEHQGQVVSRERLIEAIWGPDHRVDARTVDQNIKRLRQHLAGGGAALIQTLRGFGYRLCAGATPD